MSQAQKTSKKTRPMIELRHQPSGLNAGFNGGRLIFSDYVMNCQQMLAKIFACRMAGQMEKRVAGNAPFELRPSGNFQAGQAKPYRRGILLVHGLSDSPYFMRYLAAFFQQNGFRVMAVLLPGHGTQPGDLLNVHWREWADTVRYGTDRLAEEVDEVYLGGLSTGAALSVRHSLMDDRVRGLMLFSPAFRITSRAAWANLHKLYSWLIPSAKWVNIKPDRDIYKYESFPKNAAAQMYGLLQDLYRQLQARHLNIPVFVAASAEDATVDSSATLEFMAHHAPHPCSRLVYYTTNPLIFPIGIPQNKIELINSVIPAQNVISFSHLSIVLPPEDAHYGVQGEYSNCLHYYPDDMKKYAACLTNSPQILQGEVTEQNLRAGIMRRLIYNPHFAALKTSMQQFIENLP